MKNVNFVKKLQGIWNLMFIIISITHSKKLIEKKNIRACLYINTADVYQTLSKFALSETWANKPTEWRTNWSEPASAAATGVCVSEGLKPEENEAIGYHGDGKKRMGGRMQNSFVWRVSYTSFDGDKGCCRGKQHQSIQILRELGTQEDELVFTNGVFISISFPDLLYLLLFFLLNPTASV